MMTSYLGIPETILNLAIILLSLIALIYWIKLYKQITKTNTNLTRGWIFIIIAAIGVLFFNLSSIILFLNPQPTPDNLQTIPLIPQLTKNYNTIDEQTLQTLNFLARIIIVCSLAIAAYLIYLPLEQGIGYQLTPINPVTEQAKKGKSKYQLNPGYSYLTLEENNQKTMEIFTDLVNHGTQGLLITRRHPNKIRNQYKLEKTPIIWLSQQPQNEQNLPPKDLASISHALREFMQKSQNGIILIEGVEYLITQNNYNEILKLIQSLDDTLPTSQSRLLLSLDPQILTQQQLHILTREIDETLPAK